MKTRREAVIRIRAAYVIVASGEAGTRELYYRGPEHNEVEDANKDYALINVDADPVEAVRRWKSLPSQNR